VPSTPAIILLLVAAQDWETRIYAEGPEDLVRRLGTSDRREREVAEERLLLHGTDSVDPLRRAAEGTDAAVRPQARRIHIELRRRLHVLDRHRARDAAALTELRAVESWAMRQLERAAYSASDERSRAVEVDALARLRGMNAAQAWSQVLLQQKPIALELKDGSTLSDFARVFELKTGVTVRFAETVSPDRTVRMKIGGAPGSTVLMLLLGPRDLAYSIAADGGVVVRPRG